MSNMHLVEHLDAAQKIAEVSNEPFLVYLIVMAKEEAAKARDTTKPVVSAMPVHKKPFLRLVQNTAPA